MLGSAMLVTFALGLAQGQAVGGEWDLEYLYAPVVASPLMESLGRPSLVPIGDRDGDGVSDFATFSIYGNGSSPGLFAFSGKDGTVLWSLNYLQGLNGSSTPSWITAIEDVTGDGVVDLLCGAPRWTSSGSNLDGAVILHSGSDGRVVWLAWGKDWGDDLGHSIAGVGDVDGDGVKDFAMVAGYLPGPPQIEQSIYVMSGADQSLIHAFQHSSFSGPYYRGAATLGQAVDADGDGVEDLLLEDPPFLHMISPVTGQTIYQVASAEIAYREAGRVSARVLDDMDGDGVPEFTAMPSRFAAAPGGVMVISGRTGSVLWRHERENMGWSVTAIADQDGDGFRDVVVGVYDLNLGSQEYGGALEFFSAATGERLRTRLPGFEGLQQEAGLGYSLAYDSLSDTLFTREAVEYGWSDSWAVLGLKYDRYLSTSATQLSAQAGGSIDLALDFGVTRAGQPYALGVSGNGLGPIRLGGVEVPLGWGPLLRSSLTNTLPPFFTDRVGTLDASGQATVTITIPPGALAPRIGDRFAFAALTGPSTTEAATSSGAVVIEVVP